MNHGSFFQEKDFLQLNRFQFSRMNKLLPNSAICFGKYILMILAIKEFISKNWERLSCKESFS